MTKVALENACHEYAGYREREFPGTGIEFACPVPDDLGDGTKREFGTGCYRFIWWFPNFIEFHGTLSQSFPKKPIESSAC